MCSKLILITDLDKKRANVQISLHLSQGKLRKCTIRRLHLKHNESITKSEEIK